ncbi:hypothetical protein [Bacillus sp. Au-Bac7]|uniref:hypothetical protein n=1 Tax=Bacillus sp. Au-Bac7 TaxID=2906458 RepID=UPI001E59CE35|nr:hypothetical protein [Bacillus sp. Au-Bac7]MCE4051889.1 hypothetical protein [Bacillus sp. Au-Bac7]
MELKAGWYTKRKLNNLIKESKRGSEITDITGQEVYEGDRVKYFSGNKATGKKFEGVVFFNKGMLYAGKNRTLAVADQIEIVREDINKDQLNEIKDVISEWRYAKNKDAKLRKVIIKKLNYLGVDIDFIKEGIRWRKVSERKRLILKSFILKLENINNSSRRNWTTKKN